MTCSDVNRRHPRRANPGEKTPSYDFEEYGPGLLTGNTAEVGFVYKQGAFQAYGPGGEPVADRTASASGELQSGARLKWDADRLTWIVTSMTIG